MKRSNWLVLIVASWSLSGVSQASDSSPIEIGSNRQLFVDRHVIDKLTNARLVLHQPVRRELAIVNEHPWERFGVSYMVTFRDGGKFRAWYRCDGVALSDRKSLTAYAESTDGIHWDETPAGHHRVWRIEAKQLGVGWARREYGRVQRCKPRRAGE